MKFCPECGTKMPVGGSFCSECGFRVAALAGSGTLPPGNADELRDKAREAAGAGNFKLALESLEELVSMDSGDAHLWNNKGLVHSKMGQFPMAVESFDKALDLDDDNPHIWYGKGAALLNEGKVLEAKTCMTKTLSLDPGYVKAKTLLIKCDEIIAEEEEEEDQESEPCPICNSGMRFWEENWWCDMCSVYPFLDDGSPYTSTTDSVCGTCGGALRRIEKYDRYWCNGCMKYAPRDGIAERTDPAPAASPAHAGAPAPGGFAAPVAAAAPASATGLVSCQRCGSRARYIQEYGRNWCDACRNYV